MQKNIQLSDRIECVAKTPAFITLEDHKDNFQSSLHCRLINPSRNKLGKVSKSILENINLHLLNCCTLTNGNIPPALENGLGTSKIKRTVPLLNSILESFTHSSQKPFSIRLYCFRNSITIYPMIMLD